MLFTLIKNNLKLLLREKMTWIFMLILPVLLIMVLSSAFTDMLNESYEMKELKVGYTLDEDSLIEENFDEFINGFKENKISLIEMEKEKAINKLENKEIIAYLEINDDKYTIYENNNESIEESIFKSAFSSVMYSYDGMRTLMEFIYKNSITADLASGEVNADLVNVEVLDVEPMPSAIVYYGIVELVYVIWVGMTISAAMVNYERRSLVDERICISNVKSSTIFFGKLISAVLCVIIQIGISATVATITMNINWGDKPILIVGLILLEIIATSSIGIMLATFLKSEALINVLCVLSAFVFGFIGGSFQTYMYNFVSDKIANLSPLFHINRTLVQIAVKGYSDYTLMTVVLLVSLFIVSGLVAMIGITRGRRAV